MWLELAPQTCLGPRLFPLKWVSFEIPWPSRHVGINEFLSDGSLACRPWHGAGAQFEQAVAIHVLMDLVV